ncbi:hypothetical protein SAMD00019534_044650 [Acytostelium subglobosum LB1]|uniref:hypothetical protein n=1 Tax=Acytostelium subglobosum LB1 TaxID=1410327 RepID=UPI000644D925|nr:hypothetical protein SAMD00019534_044650 [Acytostelium subglobosum LB1]GAM21290.1 hypothetical protein SAMD00019534_044650 [Acytostelium subglobosum LB1]|eukprot:XP_012755409.1 hypothetical protein SAMD00019534_044650 [Acytostelium subglobosum LB1]
MLISTGYNHLHFVDDVGIVYAKGSNLCYQLGVNYDVPWLDHPTKVTYFQDRNIKIKALAAGREHSLFISDTGQCYGCGDNTYGQTGLGLGLLVDNDDCDEDEQSSNRRTLGLITFNSESGANTVTSCYCGDFHSIVIDSALGLAYSFGWGLYYQLGNGQAANLYTPAPINIQSQSINDNVDGNGTGVSSRPRIIKAACGTWHSLLLDDEGQVYSFGWGEFGQLGQGDTDSCTTPTIIESLMDDIKIIDISCGSASSLLLDDQQRLLLCGQQWRPPNTSSSSNNPFEPWRKIMSPAPIILPKHTSRVYCNTWTSYSWT